MDELFEALKLGDAEAVDEIYKRLRPIVTRYCFSFLKNETDAEDATQRALIKMFEQATAYDPSRPALGWALSFAYWECRTESSRRRRRKHESLDAVPETASLLEPEALVTEAELLKIVSDLLQQLSLDERLLLLGEHGSGSEALSHLSDLARRKRKQRIFARLREAFEQIVHPENQRRAGGPRD